MSVTSTSLVTQIQENPICFLQESNVAVSTPITSDRNDDEKKEEAPHLISSGHFTGLHLCSQSSYISSMPYVLCNEAFMEKTLSFLKEKIIPSHPSSVHVGFSVWFNYDIMSVTNPSLAIVCDIDNHALQIFTKISSCLNQSSSRKSFIHNLKKDLIPFLKNTWGLSNKQDIFSICNLAAELNRPHGWLSTEDQFLIIKNMSAEGRILYQNLDLTDCSGKFSQIAHWLQSRSLQTSTLYASNILEWIQTASMQKQEQALKNLRILSNENTFFIQAYSPPLCKKTGPQQHISKGPSSIQLPKFLQKKRS